MNIVMPQALKRFAIEVEKYSEKSNKSIDIFRKNNMK